MRAIGIKAFGGPEVLEALATEPKPPRDGEVLVKVAFAGVNPIDVHVRRGAFVGTGGKRAALPLVLGYEGSGVVEAVGPHVADVAAGDRVAWCGVPGSHAEMTTVPAWRIVRVPLEMPLDVACALQLDGMLAHALTVSVFPIKAQDCVLVHAGADPSAGLLIQIARAQGAIVIATVASEADVGGPASAGADQVIVLSSGDPQAEIMAATRGQGCNVVYDAFGKSTIALSLACCRRRGVVALHAAQTGAVDAVGPDDLAAAGSLYLTRPHLADYMQDATEVRWRMNDVFDAWLRDHLRLGGGRILPLEAAREGHLAIEGGAAVGKILLKI